MSTTRRLHFIRNSCEHRGTIASCPLQSIFTTSKKTKKQTTVSINVTQLEYPSYRSDYPPHIFVGSCNGILCLAHEFSVDDSFVVLLWNPSLRKVKELPQSRYPNLSSVSYGFGYDFVTDNYKVVAVLCYKVHDSSGDLLQKAVVMINILGTNIWKNIKEFPFDSMIDSSVSGKFVSGTINWLASKDSFTSWVIVSLDLENESYQELVQPDYGAVKVVTLTLEVVRDCLCILAHSDTFSDVWLMKEYGNKDSWTKLFRIPYTGDVGSCPYTKALYVSEDDQVLLECQSGLVVYNSRDGTFKTPEIQNINSWMVPEVYEESLISPCSQ
jgi:F-box interacting protein